MSSLRRLKRSKNKRKRNKNRRLKDTGVRLVRRGPNFPPETRQRPVQCRKMRYFITTAEVNAAFSMNDILHSMSVVVAPAQFHYPIMGSVKLRRIAFYTAPSTNFDVVGNELAFQWVGLGGPPETVTDRGTSTEPACIKVSVPVDSYLNQFFDGSTPNVGTTFMNWSAPAGTIVDLEYEYVISDGVIAPLALVNVPVTTGFYCMTICHTRGDWVPDGGVNTIF